VNVTWKLGISTGRWAATHRGIRIVINVNQTTGKASEIAWFIGGQLDEISPVDCDVGTAQKLAIIVADRRILEEGNWAEAEVKDLHGVHLSHHETS
jgi:hypothetical protein